MRAAHFMSEGNFTFRGSEMTFPAREQKKSAPQTWGATLVQRYAAGPSGET